MAGNETSIFNGILLQWKNRIRRKAINNVIRMSGSGKPGAFSNRITRSTEGKLSQSIGSVAKKEFGQIMMVGFNFPRHGVYFHHGVGKGWRRINGKVVRTAKGPQNGIRTAKDFLNSEIDKTISELADDLVRVEANAVINATRAKIN